MLVKITLTLPSMSFTLRELNAVNTPIYQWFKEIRACRAIDDFEVQTCKFVIEMDQMFDCMNKFPMHKITVEYPGDKDTHTYKYWRYE